jgi:molybdopterin molybdotransferase
MNGRRGSSGRFVTHISWAQARAAAWESVAPTESESVQLAHADGRIVIDDIAALFPLPSFPTAAMDGWAVRSAGPWRIAGTVSAGDAPVAQLRDGDALRIATGAPVPEGADRIIAWEDSVVTGDELTVLDPDSDITKTHMRPSGEECQAGTVLAVAGVRLNPALIGLLSAAGHDAVVVRRQPRVRLIVMGNEVVASGIPDSGKVRDALGVQIPMWVARLGGVVIDAVQVGDDLDELTQLLKASVLDVDAVITTGGTSRGHRDHLREAVGNAAGSLVFDGVDVRPGHPMMLGLISGTPIIGLPGNPLSALVAMVTVAAPVLDGLLGRPIPQLGSIRLAEDLRSSGTATRLVLGTDFSGDFVGVDHASSAMLRGISRADGWAIIYEGGAAEGANVDWLPLPWRPRQ